MRWYGPAIAVVTLLCSSALFAQGFASSDVADRKHLDPAGKPCLETSGSAIPLASNPRIQSHLVSLSNHCIDLIRAKICYYKTDDCTDVEVPGRSRKEQALGVFPELQLFKYQVKEQFLGSR
jgi:hypothetical protein